LSFTHRIEGGEQLEEFFKAFPIKAERKFLVAGLRGPVKRIKARIRREVKSRFKKHTGVLMRSVKHKSVKAKYGAGIVIEMSSIDGETRSIKTKFKRREKIKSLKAKKAKGKFKDAYYARFLIKGTKTKGGKQRIKGNPFLDDALRAETGSSIKEFNASLIKALEKEAAKMLLK